jgi:hypothetical protein
MKMHIVFALAAVLGLTMPVSAGELDREFKGSNLKVPATTPTATSDPASGVVSGTELDDESPMQAGRHWGGGWGWGHHGWHGGHHGWHGGHHAWHGGHHHHWGWGVGIGVGYGWGRGSGWGGWGGYGWHRPYYGYYGSLGYWPSYYRPNYSYYPSWSIYAYRYPGWGYTYW